MKKSLCASILAAVITMFAASVAAAPGPASIPIVQRLALMALYDSTNGSGWTDATNWRTDGAFSPIGTECTWFGVTCNEVPSVIKVELSGNNLTGALPPELGNLSTLTMLDLADNAVGGEIPSELADLDALIHCWLNDNRLSGSLPPELADMNALYWLLLWNNQLSGSIPSEFGSFTSLNGLFLSNNGLTGTIPPELGDLDTLVYLNLDNNQLSGPIPPELANLDIIENIYLYTNDLTGEIPPELGDLTTLRYLAMRENHLEGSIPSELGDLTNLIVLDLQSNKLTGEIPAEITNMTGLLAGGSAITLGWNGLFTDDPTVDAFVDSCHAYIGGYEGTWEETQTIAPSNVAVDSIHDTTAWLTWDAILYTDPVGGYEVWSSPTGTENWTSGGWAGHENATTFPVTGLDPGTTYDFAVSAFTYDHLENDNDVHSEISLSTTGTTSSIGCDAPAIEVHYPGFPVTLSLTSSYNTYDWSSGATTPTVEVLPKINMWSWVEVTWPGPCTETAAANVNPAVIFPDGFESGDTSLWSTTYTGP